MRNLYTLIKELFKDKELLGLIAGTFSPLLPYMHSLLLVAPHELGHAFATEILGGEPIIKIYPSYKRSFSLTTLKGETVTQSLPALASYENSFLYGAGPAANLLMGSALGYVAKTISNEHPIVKGVFKGFSICSALYPVYYFLSDLFGITHGDFVALLSHGPIGQVIAIALPLIGAHIALKELCPHLKKYVEKCCLRKKYKKPTIQREFINMLSLGENISREEAEKVLEKEKECAILYFQDKVNPHVRLSKLTRLKAFLKRKDPSKILAEKLYVDTWNMELEAREAGDYHLKKGETEKVAKRYNLDSVVTI